jgi:nicotinate-nucleotide adenylyltransferase
MEVPAMAISSTDCRDRVRAGGPVWYLVPDGVVQYISKHHLYAASALDAASSTPNPQNPTEEHRDRH